MRSLQTHHQQAHDASKCQTDLRYWDGKAGFVLPEPHGLAAQERAGAATELPWRCHEAATALPWRCHGAASELPATELPTAMPQSFHGAATALPRSCHRAATERGPRAACAPPAGAGGKGGGARDHSPARRRQTPCRQCSWQGQPRVAQLKCLIQNR